MNYLALTAGELSALSPPGFRFAGLPLGNIISAALPYFFAIAGFALLIYIVLGGFAILTSKGDEKAVAAAKAKITYGIAGFFIVFTAYWIVQIVGNILGIQIITTIFQ